MGPDPRRCSACGALCDDVDVHFIGGTDKDGVVCSGALTTRERFWKRIRALFSKYSCSGRLRSPFDGSRRQLALALGGGGLPKRLAFSLPRIFIETFGAWARDERARRVAINLADSTDVP